MTTAWCKRKSHPLICDGCGETYLGNYWQRRRQESGRAYCSYSCSGRAGGRAPRGRVNSGAVSGAVFEITRGWGG